MSDLNLRLAKLYEVVQTCQDRIDPDALKSAQATLDRAGKRMSLSPDVTVIAIAGATGAGKSSVFNALSRTALAESGVRRPMTTRAMSITFGDFDTSALLDWLQISQRHIGAAGDLNGVVLLDMADNDSVAKEHREEVDRLAQVVDQFLWVVDPQKYADAVLHEGYIRRFAAYQSVMTFVLNQADKLASTQLDAVEKDFVRILKEDGIDRPHVFAISALTGFGVDTLRKHIAKIASTKRALVERLEADVLVQGKALTAHIGKDPAGALGKSQLDFVSVACLEVAGAEQISDAVRVSYRKRGSAATGLPWLAWTSKLRVDPLKRLHLDQFRSKRKNPDPPEITRTSVIVHPVARARIDIAMRTLGDEAQSRLPREWGSAMNRLVRSQTAELPDVIDQAVLSTDLGLNEGHGWWNVIRIFQWVLFAITLVGLGWLAVNFVLVSFLNLPQVVTPQFGALSLPTWLAIGGLALGLVLAGISRIAVWVGAKTASRRAVRRLRQSMTAITSERVLEPINEELRRHDSARLALQEVLR